MRLASKEFPRGQHKLAYQVSKILRSAKSELEILQQSLNDLAVKCGFEIGQGSVEPETIKTYNKEAAIFMKDTTCEIWGHEIDIENLAHVDISPLDLANLDWLIVENPAEGGQ